MYRIGHLFCHLFITWGNVNDFTSSNTKWQHVVNKTAKPESQCEVRAIARLTTASERLCKISCNHEGIQIFGDLGGGKVETTRKTLAFSPTFSLPTFPTDSDNSI